MKKVILTLILLFSISIYSQNNKIRLAHENVQILTKTLNLEKRQHDEIFSLLRKMYSEYDFKEDHQTENEKNDQVHDENKNEHLSRALEQRFKAILNHHQYSTLKQSRDLYISIFSPKLKKSEDTGVLNNVDKK